MEIIFYFLKKLNRNDISIFHDSLEKTPLINHEIMTWNDWKNIWKDEKMTEITEIMIEITKKTENDWNEQNSDKNI